MTDKDFLKYKRKAYINLALNALISFVLGLILCAIFEVLLQ